MINLSSRRFGLFIITIPLDKLNFTKLILENTSKSMNKSRADYLESSAVDPLEIGTNSVPLDELLQQSHFGLFHCWTDVDGLGSESDLQIRYFMKAEISIVSGET